MQQPPVVLWFKVYCAGMALLYVVCAAIGAFILLFGERMLEMPRGEGLLVGIMLLVMCVPLIFVFGGAIFLPRRPWAWITDLVLIALGFTGCCTLPFSIALLIFWIRPEAKAYFGRT